jgi:hypothetical protein
VPIHTLYKWLSQGHGPPNFRIGRTFRYRKSDVMRWLSEQIGDALTICGSKCGKTYPRKAFKQAPDS